jgi:hypothetical protein
MHFAFGHPVRFAPKRWLVASNPHRICPKAHPPRSVVQPCPAPKRLAALTTRPALAETIASRWTPVRFVSVPLALASEANRFPGWRPRLDPRGFSKAPARVDPL